MERREQYKRLIMFLASALIMAIQTGLFAYVWFQQYNDRAIIKIKYFYRGNWALIALYGVILFLFLKVFGGFKVGYLRVVEVLFSQVISVLFTNAIAYLQLALIGRWKFLHHIEPMIWLTCVELLVVLIWTVFMRWIYSRIYPPRSMLFIYGDYSPVELMEKISKREDKYQISEAVHLSLGEQKIKERINEYHAVVLGDMPSHERNLYLKYCFEKDIRCYSVPKISDIMIMSSDKIHLFDSPLLLFRNRRLTIEQQICKRIFDLVCSLTGLILASPIMIVIAILIKAYDRGPVFYKQDRLTTDGRIFQVYKFRSMRVDSEATGARLAMKGDSRVTPIGRVLRNIHFDELPQLFNIIKGDMSLVGPRPERPEIAAEYTKEIPEFPYRLKVKAGLTGYAQVYGKYNTTPYDKLKLDLTYIENYSFLLDIQILMTTFKILFQKENTEGVEQWQVTAATKENHKNPKKSEIEKGWQDEK